MNGMLAGPSRFSYGYMCAPEMTRSYGLVTKLTRFGHTVIIAIEIILCLGGLFVLLAAFRVLPNTVNIISQHGAIGLGVGFAISGIGTLAFVISALSVCCTEKREKWLFTGKQTQCNGHVLQEESNVILDKLDQNKPSSIQFNRSALTGDIQGGTCTAMSLTFLATYFRIKAQCPICVDYQTYMQKHLSESGSQFKTSSQEMRDLQAAFNAIEVVDVSEKTDHAQDKIQSLVNYYGFTIDWASDHVDTLQKDAITSVMEHLPDGVFLMRILKPANNVKLEEHGHSLVYIKENGLHLFYDPNFGLRSFGTSDPMPYLTETFSTFFDQYQGNDGRFYRIQPTA